MRVVTWNVNGLRAVLRKGALRYVVEHLGVDVLCLQETRVDLATHSAADELRDVLGEGTHALHATNHRQPGYSGVVIAGPEKWLEPCPLRDEWLQYDEGRVVAATVQGRFTLLCVYAPNTGKEDRVGYKETFLSRLCDEVRHQTRHAPVVVCGDFNAVQGRLDVYDFNKTAGHAGNRTVERDSLRELTHGRGTGLIDVWRAHNQGVRQFTWWDQRYPAKKFNQGWRIDTFFASGALMTAVDACTIHDEVRGSDHCPVSLDITEGGPP